MRDKKIKYYLICCFFSILCLVCLPAFGNLLSFTQYPIEKIRPTMMTEEGSRVTIRLAGNEYEAVIIGVFNAKESYAFIKDIIITPPPETIFSAEFYMLDYYFLETPSVWFAPAGTRGRWPDPLLPLALKKKKEQLFVSQERIIQVPPGENRLFLIDFYLPGTHEKREETWEITLRTFSGEVHFLVTLSPWQFNLPRESSVATAFQLSKAAIVSSHTKLSSIHFDAEQLYLDYLEILARHKIFIYAPYVQKIGYERDGGGQPQFDWQGFDGLTGAMLDGTLFEAVPRATSFRIPAAEDGLSATELNFFYTETVRHMREKGWLERMFYYAPDEPLLKDYAGLKDEIAGLKAIDEGLKILITEPYTPKLEPWADIWCPDIPYLGDSVPFLPAFFKGQSPHPNLEWQLHYPPAIYKKQNRAGKKSWLYTCTSAQVFDYPNLFIDSNAQYQRIIPWLMYKYGFTGFLYYHLNLSFATKENPWKDQYMFWTHGDGNQLYPGIPEMDFISRHTPVIAIRLKILREGFEDYEYLKKLADSGHRQASRRLCNTLVTTSVFWEHRTPYLGRIREQLGREIEESLKIQN